MTDGQKDGWTSGLVGVLSQPIKCSMYFLFSFTIRFIVCSVCSYVSILYELNVVLSELRAYLNRCSLTAPALHIVPGCRMKERTAAGPRLPCRRAPVYPDSPRSCARQRTVDWPARATSEAQLCHGARGDNTPPRPAGPRVTQESSKYFWCTCKYFYASIL